MGTSTRDMDLGEICGTAEKTGSLQGVQMFCGEEIM